jgi:MSHA biogenesis protein MshJ
MTAAPMLLERWRQWRKLFAARSRRERALVAALAVGAVVVLFDTLALSPLAAQHQRLAAQLAESRAAIRAGEAALAGVRGQADPDEVKRRYRDELRKQIAEMDQRLQGLQKQLVPPDQVSRLLEGVLGRERGLALVSLRKLPVQRYRTNGAAAKTVDGKAPAAESGRGIYQHSFEVTVEGSYGELHGYLKRLEALPWQLFWGKAELDAAEHPRLRLTLMLHTLSLNQAWLVV